MDKDEYHKGTARLSSSGAKEILRSPAHFMLRYGPNAKPQKTSAAMAFGTALHTLVLEGEAVFKNTTAADPGINRKTKAGRAEWQEFLERNHHIRPEMIFKMKDIDHLYQLRDAVYKHPVAGGLLESGRPEVYFEWTDIESGAPCKALADWVDDGVMIDLKSCVDASPSGFAKSVFNFKYHLSAEFYKMGYIENNQGVVPEWYWIAAEKDTHQVAVYTMDEASRALGKRAARDAMKIFEECRRTGRWQSYPTTAQELVSPAWAR